MFGRATNSEKPKAAAPRKGYSPSVIAAGMHVLGNIVTDGALDIDGKIDGNVRAETISIRPNGMIRGDVMADVVHVYGAVEGLIKARTVLLYADAKVVGTIMHESLTVEDGAIVDGKFKRMDRVAMEETDLQKMRQLRAPSIDTSYNDNEEPQSEAEIKILENLRLIS